MADREPLVIEAPEPVAKPPDVPTTADVPNDPPPFNDTAGTPAGGQPPAKKGRRQKDEFALLGDIQDAFRAMPTNAARQRAWEWITGWLGEEYPTPQTLPAYSSSLSPDAITRLMAGYTTQQAE